MRKIYSLLAMFIVTMLTAFTASAGSYQITIDIDNPAAVEIYQSYDANGNYGRNVFSLVAGNNTVVLNAPYGGGAGLYVQCKAGYTLTSITANGVQQGIGGAATSYDDYVDTDNKAYVIRTGDLSALRTEYVTVNIDNASGVQVKRVSDPVELHNGSNTVWYIPGEETPIRICHTLGNYKELGSVKYNGTEIPYQQYNDYEINPSNGGVIDIVTYNPNATRYTLTFEGNLNAITGIQIGGTTMTSGWESGSISFEEGTSGNILFDNDNYEYSDVFVDGYDQNVSGNLYPLYFYMADNKTVSFTATPKAGQQVTSNKASFTIRGWDGNGLGINKGTSSYDTPVEFSSTDFNVEFTEDTQSYYIYTTGGYRLSSVQVMHNGVISSKTIYGNPTQYCTVELANDDAVLVEVYKFVDVYTATLSITADLSEFDYEVAVINNKVVVPNDDPKKVEYRINKRAVLGGDNINIFKFDPTDDDDRDFTLYSAKPDQTVILDYANVPLFSVKMDGEEVQGANGVYHLGKITDGTKVHIVAVDPESIVKEPAVIEFANTNNNEAIQTVTIQNVDLAPADYAAGNVYEGANVGDYFVIYFKPGYVITDLVFCNETYNYNSNISTSQPLDFDGTSYQFSGYITEDYMGVSFTATVHQVTYSKLVTFNVNIPAGVKITDISDNKNTIVPINSTNAYYTFTSEYNYIDIESAAGYNLTKVTINPNDGNASYDRTPSDNKVGSVMVDSNYIITIAVEAAAGPAAITANVTVIGDPAKITFMRGDNRVPVSLSAGDNEIELYANPSQYMIMGDIETVTVNGNNINITDLGIIAYYDLMGIKPNDNIVITTAGASQPPVVEDPTTFTVTVNGTLEKIDYLMDYDRNNYTLVLGDNTFELPDNTKSYDFMLSGSEPLYSVKLNDEPLNAMYGGDTFMFSIKAGDHLVIDTDYPQVDVNISWNFVGCSSAIVTDIKIGDGDKINADDEGFADYLDGFTVNMGTNIQIWLDGTNFTLSSVKFNGELPMTPTNTYQEFVANGDTEITINASQKRVYNWTLKTNMPSKLLVYAGSSANGETIALDGENTTLQVDEINGITCFTISKLYGFLFNEDLCEMDGVRLMVNADDCYVVYPEENSVVTITLREVDRDLTGAIFVDDLSLASRVALCSGRFSAFDSEENTESGYHIFHFNANDRGTDGFTLHVESTDEDATPFIFVNDELQTAFSTDTHQLSGLMLADGDVIKVYFKEEEQPAPQTVTFSHQTLTGDDTDEDVFTITIDRITMHNAPSRKAAPAEISSSSADLLPGTEVKIAASEDAVNPWVKVDGTTTRFSAGGSHTFAVTGAHEISYGQHYETTGINDIMQGIAGSDAADIYTLQGVCIKRNASGSDIKTLVPGIYVIGGHKVFVK